MKPQFKVTNKSTDARRFRDAYTGCDVDIPAKGSVLTHSQPTPHPLFTVVAVDEKTAKKE